MDLSAAQRAKLKSTQFALPGRRYPLNDISHARNALARAAQYATPQEQATIGAAVNSKYPSIGAKDDTRGGVDPAEPDADDRKRAPKKGQGKPNQARQQMLAQFLRRQGK